MKYSPAGYRNLPRPALHWQGRARSPIFLKGRLQVMNVIACQPTINFAHQILSASFLKVYI